jgi:hypothetical protein
LAFVLGVPNSANFTQNPQVKNGGLNAIRTIVIMQKSLAIFIEAEMYDALQRVVGHGKISTFLQELARPHVMKEALEWSNGLIGDVAEADSAVR